MKMKTFYIVYRIFHSDKPFTTIKETMRWYVGYQTLLMANSATLFTSRERAKRAIEATLKKYGKRQEFSIKPAQVFEATFKK